MGQQQSNSYKYNPQNEAFLNFKTKRTYFVL